MRADRCCGVKGRARYLSPAQKRGTEVQVTIVRPEYLAALNRPQITTSTLVYEA